MFYTIKWRLGTTLNSMILVLSDAAPLPRLIVTNPGKGRMVVQNVWDKFAKYIFNEDRAVILAGLNDILVLLKTMQVCILYI